MKKHIVNASIIIVLFSFTHLFASPNQSVRLSPTRIIFTERHRADNVRIINPNSETCRYRISMVTVRMDEAGNRTITNTPTEEEVFAQELIRFSPRQVTIPGGGSQVVRLMVKKNKKLPDGEYRAQLKVEPIPDPAPASGNGANTTPKKIGINIEIVFQVSIPIFVRQGTGEVNAVPHDPILRKDTVKNTWTLALDLERQGPFSMYSDIIAYRIPKTGGQKIKIGQTLGLPSYTPLTRQQVTFPVSDIDPSTLKEDKLVIDILNCEHEAKPLRTSMTFPMIVAD